MLALHRVPSKAGGNVRMKSCQPVIQKIKDLTLKPPPKVAHATQRRRCKRQDAKCLTPNAFYSSRVASRGCPNPKGKKPKFIKKKEVWCPKFPFGSVSIHLNTRALSDMYATKLFGVRFLSFC